MLSRCQLAMMLSSAAGEAPAAAAGWCVRQWMERCPVLSHFCSLYPILSFTFVDVLFALSARVTLNPCNEIQA